MKTPIKKLLSLVLPLVISLPFLCPAFNVLAAPIDNRPAVNQPQNIPANYQPLPPNHHQQKPKPQHDWNPWTAPNDELELHGYPPKPIDMHEFQHWRELIIAKAHHDELAQPQSFDDINVGITPKAPPIMNDGDKPIVKF